MTTLQRAGTGKAAGVADSAGNAGTFAEARGPAPGLPGRHAGLIPLSTTPGHLIRRAQQVHERIWQQQVGPGLTSVQYALLLSLAARPGMDQRSIVEAISLDKSNVADVLRRLGKRGHLVEAPHPDDGRRKVVRPTGSGVATMLGASPAAIRVQQEVMAPLPPDAQSTCLTLLRLVAFRGSPPRRPPAGDAAEPVAGWPAGLPPLHLPTAPGHLIRRSQQVHTLLWSEHVGPRLTSMQFAVLMVLDVYPDIDQRTLGQHASLDKSTGGNILTRMVSRGLVRRTRDPEDGRRNLLQLTPPGREALLQHESAVVRVQRELLTPLSGGQAEVFLSLMGKLARISGQA